MSKKTKNHKSKAKKTPKGSVKAAVKTAAKTSAGPKVLVTGAMGLTGAAILRRMIEKYGKNNVLGVGRRVEGPFDGAPYEQVNLHDDAAVQKLFEAHNFEIVVQAAHVSFSPKIMEFADKFKCKRAILFLTTGIYSKFQQYREDYEKYEAAILRKTWKHCQYTVIRPTMIYGVADGRKDYNLHKLITLVKRMPVVPLFGGGKHSVQPVHHEDLAKAVVDMVDVKATYNKAFNLSGGTVIPYGDMLRLMAKLLNVRRIFLPISIPTALLAVKMKDWLWPERFVTKEQILRLTEQRVFSYHEARDAFGYTPRSIEEGLRDEVERMRLAGLI